MPESSHFAALDLPKSPTGRLTRFTLRDPLPATYTRHFMASTHHTPDAPEASRSSPEGAAQEQHSLNSQVRALLLECTGREELAARVPALCARQFGSTVERFELRVGGVLRTWISHRETMSDALAERFNSEMLAPIASQVCSGNDPQPRLKQLRRGEQHITVLSVPVLDLTCDRIEGAITLLIGGQPRPEVVLPRLDGMAAVVSTVLAVLSDSASAAAPADHHDAHTSDAAVDQEASAAALHRHTVTAGQASQFESTREFGYSIVNSLCGQLDAEQVFFGVERRQRIVMEAVSGVVDFKAGSPGVATVRQAMEECFDAQSPIVCQPQKPPDIDTLPIHRQWSSGSQNACVCSVPLKHGERIVGVVSLRRPADQSFTAEELTKLQQILEPFGAAVRLVERANASAGQVIRASMTNAAQRFTSGSHPGRAIAAGLAIVGLLWFLLGSITYHPLCHARITAADLHHVAAPFNGQLRTVNVTPGHVVRAGDLLAEFDTTDLRLELNRLTREIAAGQVRLREAIQLDDMSQAAMARSRISVLEAQADSVRRQIDAAQIVAPQDGTVILADLDQRIGQEFSQGDEILQFASGQEWLLEIEIPDDIVHYIAADQTGEFAAAALPVDQQSFSIQHIDGAATTRDDRNVFVARATMASHPSWMKSGMEGTARIESVARPVWWVTLHRVVDWVRTSFWI